MMSDNTYNNFLISLLENNPKEINSDEQSQLKFNLYLTLLSLNNDNYPETYDENNSNIIDDFLRKTNNLKIKIQLKRKDEEINKLLDNLIIIYKSNQKLINKYNEDNLDILEILKQKKIQELTNLIDKLTQKKYRYHTFYQENKSLRKDIINNIFNYNKIIQDNILYIKNPDQEISIKLSDFYLLFDYLLDINLYNNIFANPNENNFHKDMINNLITQIEKNTSLKDNPTSLIPLILTYLSSQNTKNNLDIDTSSFNIENIKITDLYSFASYNDPKKNNTAKWEKVNIPNEYLLEKLTMIIKKGMYYKTEDKYVFENICCNKTSDFKVSIANDKIIPFLKESIILKQ